MSEAERIEYDGVPAKIFRAAHLVVDAYSVDGDKIIDLQGCQVGLGHGHLDQTVTLAAVSVDFWSLLIFLTLTGK